MIFACLMRRTLRRTACELVIGSCLVWLAAWLQPRCAPKVDSDFGDMDSASPRSDGPSPPTGGHPATGRPGVWRASRALCAVCVSFGDFVAPIPSGGDVTGVWCAACDTAATFRAMFESTATSQAVRPLSLAQHLDLVASRFRIGTQDDAAEFLAAFFEAVDKLVRPRSWGGEEPERIRRPSAAPRFSACLESSFQFQPHVLVAEGSVRIPRISFAFFQSEYQE
jgi:hypothetical protein